MRSYEVGEISHRLGVYGRRNFLGDSGAFAKRKRKSGNIEILDYTGNSYQNERLFTSREYDRESGLFFYRARYYDAELGRFVSQDPIGIADNINLYNYVGGNPVNWADPLGLYVDKEDAKDQYELFEKYKKASKESIQKSWTPNVTASLRSFSCSKDNIKCNKEWMDVAYDKNKDNKENTRLWVKINGEEIPLDKVGNYFVGYNGRYGGKTLNNPKGTIFNDIYKAGTFVEKYGEDEDDGIEDGGEEKSFYNIFNSDERVEKDENEDHPWYDRGYYDADKEIKCAQKNLVKK